MRFKYALLREGVRIAAFPAKGQVLNWRQEFSPDRNRAAGQDASPGELALHQECLHKSAWTESLPCSRAPTQKSCPAFTSNGYRYLVSFPKTTFLFSYLKPISIQQTAGQSGFKTQKLEGMKRVSAYNKCLPRPAQNRPRVNNLVALPQHSQDS
jgi:hypothetical protein